MNIELIKSLKSHRGSGVRLKALVEVEGSLPNEPEVRKARQEFLRDDRVIGMIAPDGGSPSGNRGSYLKWREGHKIAGFLQVDPYT